MPFDSRTLKSGTDKVLYWEPGSGKISLLKSLPKHKMGGSVEPKKDKLHQAQ